MTNFKVYPIGKVRSDKKGTFIEFEEKYIPAMKAMEGFSHINVLWWFSDFDNEQYREVLEAEQPYKKAPAKMGIFATRSPIRPNPIALTTVEIISIDYQNGIIQIAYIDVTILGFSVTSASLHSQKTPCGITAVNSNILMQMTTHLSLT